jgi:hypothetical protein
MAKSRRRGRGLHQEEGGEGERGQGNSPEIRGMPLYGKVGKGAIFFWLLLSKFAPASCSCCHGGMTTAAWLLCIPLVNSTKHESTRGPLALRSCEPVNHRIGLDLSPLLTEKTWLRYSRSLLLQSTRD